MTSTQNAAGDSLAPVTAKDFIGRELNVGDKVAYATANIEGTADLHSAWIINLRTVTSNMYGKPCEYAVADMSYDSKDSTKVDYYQAASELVLVEEPRS